MNHVIRLPSREWAECAAGDLRGAGYRATVLPEADHWMLVVHGSEEQIQALKDGIAAAQVPSSTLKAVDWAAFINEIRIPFV